MLSFLSKMPPWWQQEMILFLYPCKYCVYSKQTQGISVWAGEIFFPSIPVCLYVLRRAAARCWCSPNTSRDKPRTIAWDGFEEDIQNSCTGGGSEQPAKPNIHSLIWYLLLPFLSRPHELVPMDQQRLHTQTFSNHFKQPCWSSMLTASQVEFSIFFLSFQIGTVLLSFDSSFI